MRRGTAGSHSPKVRSDCRITVELRDSDGITLELRSKVEALYGASIRAQLTAGLRALGVEHAHLDVDDTGALPFVLDARLETAVRRADPSLSAQLLPERRVRPAPSPRDRFRRSRLYLPGNTPKLMVNAGLHRPDGVILDLEDAVAPAEKDAARCIVRNALRVLDFRGAELMVRINQGQRGLDDLRWVVPHGVQLLLLPKVETAAQVRQVDSAVGELMATLGREEPVWLMPIVESARGALDAYEIATASPRVVALAHGLEDYTADLGVQRTLEGTESFWMRSRIVNAARAAGVQAIDTVFSDVADEAGLRASVREARALGFDGKGCIHPRQIGPVHQEFAPSQQEIDRATRIVLAFEAAEARGLGVVSLGSKMIDPPVVQRALHTVDLALATGKLRADWRAPEPPAVEVPAPPPAARSKTRGEPRMAADISGAPEGFVRNAAGRLVPTHVNGVAQAPFQGVGAFQPTGRKAGPTIPRCTDYPASGDKRVATLKEALQRAGLRDGMTISTHHHFRNGDLVANMIFDAAAELGVKDLRWFPSAAFPCHAPIIEHQRSGVVRWIEGSLNGPLGNYASEGNMAGTAILRSHGGRWQAIQDGEVHIDIAVLAAPTADAFGNATGDRGPSACGSLNFGLADSLYADKVIVVTDNLVPFPCLPWQIQGNNVDHVVVVDKVGIPEKIISGTTRITRSPDRLLIAELTARLIRATAWYRPGFSMQAGAGGTALATAIYLKEYMKQDGVTASFMRGGSTKYLVQMLEEGLIGAILDGQTFDLEGVRSMRENPRHVPTSPFTSYNWHGKGNFASMVDYVVLGATEVDVDFNANVVTHSDGRMLHGIGGWQNCLFANVTILPIPSFRNRIPVLVDEVTTLTGPGELVDVIVTERGMAINPRRDDLREQALAAGLPVRPIHELKAEIEALCGGPAAKPELTDEVIGVIKWVDGTIIDSVFRLA